jgi:peptidoglycan-N-acetylglucosamine deacetylase
MLASVRASVPFLAGSARLLKSGGRGNAPLHAHGPRSKPHVALTFDDGPGAATPVVLNVLRSHGVRATFFVLGDRVGRWEKLLREMSANGHEVANHSWNHRLGGNPLSDLAQLTLTSAAIRRVTGVRPRLFRPPHGHCTHRLLKIASAARLYSVGWDVDPRDWSNPGADEIASRVLDSTAAGSIILLHDDHPTEVHDGHVTNAGELASALEQSVSELVRRGYDFVTVSELLGASPTQRLVRHRHRSAHQPGVCDRQNR